MALRILNKLLMQVVKGQIIEYHVIVKEGRNRLVRRLWESQNVRVSRLIRIRFGNITLPRVLRRGKWAELTPEEITQL